MTGMRQVVVSRCIGAAATLALLAAPTAARAANMSFDQVENGGTVVSSGGGNYVGSDIIFEYITYAGGAAFCGPVANTTTGSNINCLLDFDTATGDFVLTAPSGLYDQFGALLPGLDGSSVTVLSGSIASFAPIDFGSGLVAFFSSGSDTKLQALLDFFGINATDSSVFDFANSELDILPDGTVQEADLTNDITPFETPEPGLLALFGMGLLGVGRRFARGRS
jgi:hypothetical protein